jgi:hypothetical protein
MAHLHLLIILMLDLKRKLIAVERLAKDKTKESADYRYVL